MPDFSKARVGDRVWYLFGPQHTNKDTNATIKSVGDSLYHPIGITMDGGIGDQTFTYAGLMTTTSSAPSLYWTRPTITGGDVPPKRTVKKAVDGWIIYNPETERFSCVYMVKPYKSMLLKNEIMVPIRHEYEVEE